MYHIESEDQYAEENSIGLFDSESVDSRGVIVVHFRAYTPLSICSPANDNCSSTETGKCFPPIIKQVL